MKYEGCMFGGFGAKWNQEVKEKPLSSSKREPTPIFLSIRIKLKAVL
jgi:hypothetical protein